MTTGTSGRRQHIIPQQMIRRFAGVDGKLTELIKAGLKIGTRRRAPSSILFHDDFYRDSVGDFDDLLKRIEQNFAPVYPKVIARERLNGQEGAALVDWIASMLVRTQLVSAVMPQLEIGSSSHADLDSLRNAKRLLDNMARSNWFKMYQDLLVRERWIWKHLRLPAEKGQLILTDHPVCMTSFVQENGPVVLVPLTPNSMLLGGAKEAVERMRGVTADSINLFLAGYAHKSMFAGEKRTLERVVFLLSEGSPFPSEQVVAARQPFLGAPHEIRERMINDSEAAGFDFGEALRQQHDIFGRPRWEAGNSPAA